MRNLAVFDPTDEFNYLREQINRMFNETMRFPSRGTSALNSESWGPSVDIHENPDNYQIEADLPGMKKEDINIDLQGNVLTLSGERKHEAESSAGDDVRVERRYGKFIRSFTLPQNVDPENIKASYNDGVLRLLLPKKEEARPKQIKVES